MNNIEYENIEELLLNIEKFYLSKIYWAYKYIINTTSKRDD